MTPSSSAKRRIRVAVVDDSEEMRILVGQVLAREGAFFEVVGDAGDGKSALDLIKTMRPDAVLLDLQMPEMDGLEAIPEIKKLSPETKIVVMSGLDASTMRDQALKIGADHYVDKAVTGLKDLGLILTRVCGYSAH
jgi:DNA-binding NarL/FixJ family response regulator